jgi:osmoprotectant transport system substrate-binding protein
VGTLLEFVNKGKGEATPDVDASLAKLQTYLTADQLTGLTPSQAQDRNALAVTKDTADKNNLTNVSDLQPVAGTLVMGGPPECPTRPLCLVGYQNVYGLHFKSFKPLDAGGPLTYKALDNGDIQVALVFSTQGQLAGDKYVVLKEDKPLQPAENVLPVIRNEKLNPTVKTALDKVSAVLTTEDLIALNKKVDIDKEDPQDVAKTYLQDKGLL